MAKVIGSSSSDGNGDNGGSDRARDECEVMRPQINDQMAKEATVSTRVQGGNGNRDLAMVRDVRVDPPPRDPMSGKGLVIEEETTTKVPAKEVEFRLAAVSSRHMPITEGARPFTLREPLGGCYGSGSPEERQRVVELAPEEERLRAEAERARVEE
ncbi:hypothetical protein RHMOL_Rhmol04G0214200 [Rhododendron molle]|uniref:Uncharacterized protein n=1 Tax=Rhododendron molle TaxID=49168 RepID=A0ACC0P2U3_RHOML|nr:hypothetical protein RHMOL_Rhmol04G0214200 [Rhododendron molle]